MLRDRHGADHVYLHTDFPTTMPNVTKQNLIMDFRVARGDGENYVREHFGMEPELVEMK